LNVGYDILTLDVLEVIANAAKKEDWFKRCDSSKSARGNRNEPVDGSVSSFAEPVVRESVIVMRVDSYGSYCSLFILANPKGGNEPKLRENERLLKSLSCFVES